MDSVNFMDIKDEVLYLDGEDDIEERKSGAEENKSFAAYDLELFEKMLNSDD